MAQVLMAAISTAGALTGFDMGPTYGQDYAGMDYNVTMWHSGSEDAPPLSVNANTMC